MSSKLNVIWMKDKIQQEHSLSQIPKTIHSKASGDHTGPEKYYCRLCSKTQNLRDFDNGCFQDGKQLQFNNMLFDCFAIKVTEPGCMICDDCINQLIFTYKFHAMVKGALEIPRSESNSSVEQIESAIEIVKKGTEVLEPAVLNHKQVNIQKRPAKKRLISNTNQRQIKPQLTVKKSIVYCTACGQKYSMIISVDQSKSFVCSRCKMKRNERVGGNRKCNIVTTKTRDLELHATHEAKGKSRFTMSHISSLQSKVGKLFAA